MELPAYYYITIAAEKVLLVSGRESVCVVAVGVVGAVVAVTGMMMQAPAERDVTELNDLLDLNAVSHIPLIVPTI